MAYSVPFFLCRLRRQGRFFSKACLKNVKTPKGRIFFRCTALKNLEIHKVFLRRSRNGRIERPCAIEFHTAPRRGRCGIIFALSIEKISRFWSFRHLSNKPYTNPNKREQFFYQAAFCGPAAENVVNTTYRKCSIYNAVCQDTTKRPRLAPGAFCCILLIFAAYLWSTAYMCLMSSSTLLE